MNCLREVMKDYKSEVKDMLAADKQLATEIEYDLKKWEEEQKKLEEGRRSQVILLKFEAHSYLNVEPFLHASER